MEYLVNGKKFSDINEARKYEQECIKSERENSIEAYKAYIKANIKIFKITEGSHISYFGVIADKDHTKYMLAIMTQLLGSRYIIRNDKLIESWKYTNETDDEIINATVDKYVSSGYDSKFVTLYKNSNIKTFDEFIGKSDSCKNTSNESGSCKNTSNSCEDKFSAEALREFLDNFEKIYLGF